MGQRLNLHNILIGILGTTNEDVSRVYFQPPETINLTYPCIVYERSRINTNFANNKPYAQQKMYTVTVIDKNPDSLIPDKISKLPMCTFSRHFTADNLNHDVFNIQY